MAFPGWSEGGGQACAVPEPLFIKPVIMVGVAEFSDTKGHE